MTKFTFAEAVTLKTGEEVYRIRAMRDIHRHKVKKGDLGGFVQFKENLSQEGDAWVDGEAKVLGKSTRVEGNAYVGFHAVVKDGSRITGNSTISRWATLSNVQVTGTNVDVFGKTILTNVSLTGKDIDIDNNAQLENCIIEGTSIKIFEQAELHGVHVQPRTESLSIMGNVKITNETAQKLRIDGYDIQIDEDVDIQECHGIFGRDIHMTGHVSLKNGVLVEGIQIDLTDAAFVEGKVKIASNVELKECVHIFNHEDIPCDLQNIQLGGDMSVDVHDILSDITF